MSEHSPARFDFESERLLLKLELTIPARVGAIDSVVEKILASVGEMGCARGKEFEIETSLREALANAIVHGAGEDPSKSVEVCVACDETRGMLIVVRDPGNGFDVDSIPSPLRGRNLYHSHGRGIYLINELMDEVRYEKNGTEIHMRKS